VGSRTASEAIAEQIRSQIATRQLEVGDRLPSERALLEQYRVARPTMRGALRILESDGLISIERGTNGGARVVEPDLAPLARRVGLHLQLRGTDLDELIAAEVVMQPGAVALAAAAHDADDLARLRDAADRSGTATTMDDYLGAVADFTDALLHAAHNNALSLYAELTGTLVREGLAAMVHEQAIELDTVEALVTESTRAFHGVVDLIEAGDAAGAESYWRAYLRETGASPTPGPSPLEVYAPEATRT
jgi:DNA-binding FadR family transcriptional regulator